MTNSLPQPIAATNLPELGQPLAGGVFIARYWLNSQELALVVLNHEYEGVWGEDDVRIKGASSSSDGHANTRAMAEAGSEIAIKALEMGAFIPSCLEGQLLIDAHKAGLVKLNEKSYYWLSSEFSSRFASSMGFGRAWIIEDLNHKGSKRTVRPVLSIPVE